MSKLALGMMRLPLTDKDDVKSIDQKEVNRMVDLCMESGLNYFDTAYYYHDEMSEVALRKGVIERYPREDVIIADKLPIYMNPKEEELEGLFNNQLERLNIDYFDYYMLHNVSGLSEDGYLKADSFGFVNKMKKEGKIKKLGISTHANAEYIENILKHHPEIEFVQLQINYLDWESNENIQARKCYEVARKYDKEVMVMEPLKGGFLVDVPEDAQKLMKEHNGEDPIKWALRFVAELEGVSYVLSGAGNTQQLKKNIEIFKDIKPLTDEEHKIIDEVVKIINSKITVDCTACNYCLSSCVKNINIPKLFSMYNHEMIQNIDLYTATGNAYTNYAKIEGNGIASDCIGCGKCMDVCPQQLDIPGYLKDVAKRFEIPLYGFGSEEEAKEE